MHKASAQATAAKRAAPRRRRSGGWSLLGQTRATMVHRMLRRQDAIEAASRLGSKRRRISSAATRLDTFRSRR